MPDWFSALGISEDAGTVVRDELRRLALHQVPAGTVLFRPGDEPRGFIVLLTGRIHVYLTGRNGRELLLYRVEPGESCLQTTLGLLGESVYQGEGVAETALAGYVIPPGLFLRLMSSSEGFRGFVFRAFANRLSDALFVLEQVAFVRVEERLARALLEAAGENGLARVTHQQLAVAIGSAREVVSRRLEALASSGLIALERGEIRIMDGEGLRRLSAPVRD